MYLPRIHAIEGSEVLLDFAGVKMWVPIETPIRHTSRTWRP